MTDNNEIDIKTLLINMLPAELFSLQAAYDNKNYQELNRLIHRLHGALCYCDVPDLRHAAARLEAALKNNELDCIPTLFKKVEFEIELLLKK